MPGTADILICVVLPSFIGGLFGLFMPRRDAERDRRRMLAPVVLGLAGGLAMIALEGWPSEQWQRLAFVTPLAIVGALVVAARPCCVLMAFIGAVLAAAAAQAALWDVMKPESGLIRYVPAIGVGVTAFAIECVAARRPVFASHLVLVIAASGATITTLVYGSIAMSLPSAAVPAALGWMALMAAIRKRSFGPGVGTVVAAMIVCVPLVAWVYQKQPDDPIAWLRRVGEFDSPPLLPLVLLPAATMTMLLARFGKAGVGRWLIACVITLGMAGGAAGLAHWGSEPAAAESEGDAPSEDELLHQMYMG